MAAAGVGWFDWDVRADHSTSTTGPAPCFGIDPASVRPPGRRRSGTCAVPRGPARRRGAGRRGAGDLRRLRGGVPGGAAGRRGPLGRGRGRVVAGADGRPRGCSASPATRPTSGCPDTVARALEHMADGFLSVDRTGRSPTSTATPRSRRPGGRGPGGRSGRSGRTSRPRATTVVRRAASTGQPRLHQVRRRGRPLVPGPRRAARRRHLVLRHRHHRPARRAAEESARSAGRTRPARCSPTAPPSPRPTRWPTSSTSSPPWCCRRSAPPGCWCRWLESDRLKLAGHSGYGAAAVALLDVLDAERRRADRAGAAHPRAAVPAVAPEAYLASFPGRTALRRRHRQAAPGPSCRSPCPGGRWAASRSASTSRATSRRTSGRCWSASAACSRRRWPGPGCATRSGPWPPSCSSSCCRGRCREPDRAGRDRRATCAATDGMGVGGDWYDVLELPGDRVGAGDRRRAGPQRCAPPR